MPSERRAANFLISCNYLSLGGNPSPSGGERMAVPAWVIEYTVVLLLGLIVGLLIRYIILIVTFLIAAVLFVWLLGYVDTSLLSKLPTLTGRFLDGLPIGPQVLFTLGAMVFFIGLFIGLLLTTRLRALDRAHGT